MTSSSLIIVLGSLGLSFLLSGMEAGVFALSRLRIRRWVRAGHKSARILQGYLDRPEDFLWTICVGNALSNFAAVGLMTWWLLVRMGDRPWLFACVWSLMAFGLYAWCELLPKVLFREFPNRLCLWTVQPYRLIHALLSPVVAVASWMASAMLRWTGGQKFTGGLFGNREELRLVMQESGEGVTDESRVMIGRVLDLQSRMVSEVMVPLEKACWVDSKKKVGEALELCRERGLSRIPVCLDRGMERRVLGIFSLRAVLYQTGLDLEASVTTQMRTAPHIRSDLKLGVALQRLQRSGHRMAIVVDAGGMEVGVISLQDILSVIFGEVTV